MAIIGQINCDKCGASIYLDDEEVGKVVPCQKCGQSFNVKYEDEDVRDDPKAPVAGSLSNSPRLPSTRVCPYCAETIPLAVIKCRFCGEFLDGSKERPITTPHVLPEHAKPAKKRSGCLTAVLIAVALGVLFLIITMINAPPTSEAYEKGRKFGLAYALSVAKAGNLQLKNTGGTKSKFTSSGQEVANGFGYEAGTPEANEFCDGYDDGWEQGRNYVSH